MGSLCVQSQNNGQQFSNNLFNNTQNDDSFSDMQYYDPFNYQIAYNDDQQLPRQVQVGQTHLVDYNFDQFVDLQIKPLTQGNLLMNNQQTQLPFSVQLKSKDRNNYSDRLPIDLIAVLDHSGSMGGEKMDLLKKSMLDLLKILHKEDRLCIVEFDNRGLKLSPLLRCTNKQKKQFQRLINNFNAKGGTNINLGILEALKTIKYRQYKNPVTGIFLLSDGMDDYADQRVQQSMNDMQIQDSFIIDTFGYGHEHCSNTMSNIARLGGGSYFFIEELHQVDEFLVDAVCSLMSTVLEDVQLQVQVQNQPQGYTQNIGKSYGNWYPGDNPNSTTFQMQNLTCGVQKDYIHELQSQQQQNGQNQNQGGFNYPTQNQVYQQQQQNQIKLNNGQNYTSQINPNNQLNFQRKPFTAFSQQAQAQAQNMQNKNQQQQQQPQQPLEPTTINVKMMAKIPGTDQMVQKETTLQLNNYFSNDLEFQALKEDPEVMALYHRVRAAEAMEQAFMQCHQGQHYEAIDLLDEILREIKTCSKSDKKNLKVLMDDLNLCMQNCQEDRFHRVGKHHLTAKIKQHIEQRSHGGGQNCPYSNNLQKQMVQQIKNRKMKFF